MGEVLDAEWSNFAALSCRAHDRDSVGSIHFLHDVAGLHFLHVRALKSEQRQELDSEKGEMSGTHPTRGPPGQTAPVPEREKTAGIVMRGPCLTAREIDHLERPGGIRRSELVYKDSDGLRDCLKPLLPIPRSMKAKLLHYLRFSLPPNGFLRTWGSFLGTFARPVASALMGIWRIAPNVSSDRQRSQTGGVVGAEGGAVPLSLSA
ncbi:hypothetical protein BDK51DRAFT_45367 [Blyttiomyces helicus]|uniref:Uncharacterized protein n=1 Tax=Blyttiomyces helicus TaxID=388810 RepID=A0A4P9WGB9_9FUNG|nr:hypothetical protein BDK51DRAFT_45367 [Blyttiomyces helicus]|eukprot:RKO91744.1 hypothetical protein BDK51DRAFT_45367 [Blyttiomyces helicus]